jgi:hypothetical protein
VANATGVITFAQEDRFQLAAADGSHHLFILTHGARSEGDDLQRWFRAQLPVRVRYRSAPHLIACIAERIAPASSEKDGHAQDGG